MTEHTPGPWHAFPDTDHGLGDDWAVDHIERGELIAAYIGNEANARLIASAPDLLDALRALFALVDDGAYIDLTDTESTPITRTLRSAIAKATGDTDA